MPTLADLLAYCREQASINPNDYFQPGYSKPEEVSAWHRDRSRRDRARQKCFNLYPARLNRASEELTPGSYGPSGRLRIEQDGSPDYTAGQYAPVEIYHALLDYLSKTN